MQLLQLDEIMARAMVDEIGLDKTLNVLNAAEAMYERGYPRVRLNPHYVRAAGFAKLYDAENQGETNAAVQNVECAERQRVIYGSK